MFATIIIILLYGILQQYQNVKQYWYYIIYIRVTSSYRALIDLFNYNIIYYYYYYNILRIHSHIYNTVVVISLYNIYLYIARHPIIIHNLIIQTLLPTPAAADSH